MEINAAEEILRGFTGSVQVLLHNGKQKNGLQAAKYTIVCCQWSLGIMKLTTGRFIFSTEFNMKAGRDLHICHLF